MTLDPTKTLKIDQGWLVKQVKSTAISYEKVARLIFEMEEVKCQWSTDQADKSFVKAISTREARLVLPRMALAKRTPPSVKHDWLRYFFAIAVQQKLPLARFTVTGHTASNLLVITGQPAMRRTFRLKLESPVNIGGGMEYLLSWLEKRGFVALDSTGILYREKTYVLLYGESVLVAGPDMAEELAASFAFRNEPPSFTYEGVHFEVSEFSDGHSVTIDCDEAVMKLLEDYSIDPGEMSADYPVRLEDVEEALMLEEAAASDRNPSRAMRTRLEPFDGYIAVTFAHMGKRLGDIEQCGRMDICAIRAYLSMYGPLMKPPLQVHLRMQQQVCHYLRYGPPYRLKFEYKPEAGLNATTITRWFPYPIDVYAWFYGDCPIRWHGKFEAPKTPDEVFGLEAPRAAITKGEDLIRYVDKLGFVPAKVEVETMLYDLVARNDESVASLPFDSVDAVPVTRQGEPFTYDKKNDAITELERSVAENQAENSRRFERARRFQQLSDHFAI